MSFVLALIAVAVCVAVGFRVGYRRGFADSEWSHDFDRCSNCGESPYDKEDPSR